MGSKVYVTVSVYVKVYMSQCLAVCQHAFHDVKHFYECQQDALLG